MNEELEEMKYDLEDLKKDIAKKEAEVIFDATGLQESEYIIGDWDCSQSPIGHCVYDKYEDPARDCCVFCGEPDERKISRKANIC